MGLVRRPPGYPEDVRHGGEWHGAEGEALTPLDHEPRSFDRGARVAVGVAPAEHSWPEGRVRQALQVCKERSSRDHVLVETQLAARPDQPKELGQSPVRIWDRAQQQRGHAGVKRSYLARQLLGDTVEDGDRYRRRVRGTLGSVAQPSLGLDGQDALDGRRVVGEVRPVARADLDHATPETVEQLATVPVRAPPYRRRRNDPLPQASEEWVVNLLLGH